MAVLLGRITAGTASTDFHSANRTGAWKFVASASGTLVTIWANPQVANPTGQTKLGIYDHDGVNNRPGNLLSSAFAAGGGGAGPFSATVSPVSIVSGTTYWLAWGNNTEQFDFKGNASGAYLEMGTFFPTPFGAGASGTTDAILWGEDAGGSAAVVKSALPFIYMRANT